MVENQMCVNGDSSFEYKHLTFDMVSEVEGFMMDHLPLQKNLQLRVEGQIEKLKKLGYEDSDISTLHWVDIKEISEQSVSFYDSVIVYMPYGAVEIKYTSNNGKEVLCCLKWYSVDYSKALNEEGVRISEALERELKAIQELKKLAEKLC